MNPDELRFITSLAESGDPHSEMVVRVTMAIVSQTMPMDFVVEMAEQWDDYMEMRERAKVRTR